MIQEAVQTEVSTNGRDGGNPASRVPWSVRGLAVVASALAVAGLMALATIFFGSASAAMAWLGGDRLLVIRPHVAFKTGRVDEHRELTYVIRNLTGVSVTIVGAGSKCTCVASKELPKTIPPGETATVHVDLRLTRNLSSRDQAVVFYTDYQKQRQLPLTFSGVVTD